MATTSVSNGARAAGIPSETSDPRETSKPLSLPGKDIRWPASGIWRSGEPEVRTISFADLKDAIIKGIDDFSAMPSHAFFLCLIYPVIGIILYRLAFGYGVLPLIYPFVTGFALVGPAAAIGLYELSRRRERGLEVSVAKALEVRNSPSIGAIMRLGSVLALLFFGWLYTAQTIYTQHFGPTPPTSLEQFFSDVTTTDAGRQLMIVGNLVGLLFAVVVLAISTVSFPMLVDRNVGAAVAVRTSLRAAIENPIVIATWGIIVVTSLLLGSLPMFVGLTVVLPVLGHTTWHLYRKLVAD